MELAPITKIFEYRFAKVGAQLKVDTVINEEFPWKADLT